MQMKIWKDARQTVTQRLQPVRAHCGLDVVLGSIAPATIAIPILCRLRHRATLGPGCGFFLSVMKFGAFDPNQVVDVRADLRRVLAG